MSASRSFAVRLRSDALVGAALAEMARASVVATRLKRILMIWDTGVCCGDGSNAVWDLYGKDEVYIFRV